METRQQAIVRHTQEGVEAILRAIRAMPEDKQTWKVDGVGRSPIDQLAECAQVPIWFAQIFESRISPFEGDFMARAHAERSEWTDLEDLERRLRENSDRLYAAILAVSDEDWDTPIELNPTWVVPLSDISIFAWRNLWYHVGQINFMQTLYGDLKMH